MFLTNHKSELIQDRESTNAHRRAHRRAHRKGQVWSWDGVGGDWNQ